MINDFIVLAADGASKMELTSIAKYKNMGITMLTWGLVVYFLFVRPNKKKKQNHQNMIESLEKGIQVITIGGIRGIVMDITDEFVEIQVDNNATLTLKLNAIAGIYKEKVNNDDEDNEGAN